MKIPHVVRWALSAAFLAVSSVNLNAGEGDLEQARQCLDLLRGIQLPKGPNSRQQTDVLNKRMDTAWRFFESHQGSLAVAERELKKEIAAKQPDQFFLMDVGHLLLTTQGAKAAGLALSALERVDPKAEVIESNWEELFHYVMKLGATGTETARYLAQMDRIYLSNQRGLYFFRAPHIVDLTPLDLCSLVYGVAGDPAAKHLGDLLGVPGHDWVQVLRILPAVGSETETPQVKAVIEASGDYKTVSASVDFLMSVGGSSGRVAVLAIDLKKVDGKARDYLEKIRPQVEQACFDAMASALSKMVPGAVSDRKLQRLLDKMEENNGQDSETPPGAVVKSGLPKDRLLAQMKRIRARSLRRETNHVFEDLRITNAIINALQYK